MTTETDLITGDKSFRVALTANSVVDAVELLADFQLLLDPAETVPSGFIHQTDGGIIQVVGEADKVIR